MVRHTENIELWMKRKEVTVFGAITDFVCEYERIANITTLFTFHSDFLFMVNVKQVLPCSADGDLKILDWLIETFKLAGAGVFEKYQPSAKVAQKWHIFYYTISASRDVGST